MRYFEEIAKMFDATLSNPARDVYSSVPNSSYKIWLPWLDGHQHGKWLNEWDYDKGEIQEINEKALFDAHAELEIQDNEMRLVWGNFADGPRFLGVFQYQQSRSKQGIRIYKRV
ncbi:MAG TPA: hypothetical protein DCW31_04175 [Lactobacillus sp.]|nr:hypothetical protein [Lactobacillus sp.]